MGFGEQRIAAERPVKWAKRRDENEREVIDALKAAGCAVQQLGDSGVPDLLVSYRMELTLLEVKLPLGARGGVAHHRGAHELAADLTDTQRKWWRDWTGKPAVIVRSPAEALAAIGVAS